MNLPFHIARLAWTKAGRQSVAERRIAMQEAARAAKKHEVEIKGTFASRTSDLQIIAGILIIVSFFLLSILQFSVAHGWWPNMKPEEALPAPAMRGVLAFLVFCFLALLAKIWRFREAFGGSQLKKARSRPDIDWTQEDAELQRALRIATDAYEMERAVQSGRQKGRRKAFKKSPQMGEENAMPATSAHFSASPPEKGFAAPRLDPAHQNSPPRKARRL